MMYDARTVQALYIKLLAFYPREFREQLGESMEQTFRDLWNEKRRTKRELFSFVLWTFMETAIGIFREYLRLIARGGIMQAIVKTVGLPALISLLLIVPFMIMEVVNRRNFNEDFPNFLFFFMWLNLFAFSLILLPIVQSRWTGNQDGVNGMATQGNGLLTNPRSAAIIGIVLIALPGVLFLLDAVGWMSVDRLFNGPNPEVMYLPGVFLSLALVLFPITAGVVAGGPIANTLRTRGSLLAHPINLIIVVFLLSAFAIGVASLIIDQWPCFMGVPLCD